MWGQIVAALAILIALSWALEKLLWRNRPRPARSRDWGREFAPLVGFVGILLVALSLVEAFRRVAFEPWLGGVVFGGIVVAIAAATGVFGQSISARGVLSAARAAGLALIFTIIGIYFAVRVIGALAQVFIESALSVFALGAAVGLFLRARDRDARVENK